MSRIKMKKLILVFIWLSLVVPCWAEVPIVKLETNFGDIIIEFFDANAPVTTANFLGYVKSGFYDGMVFHRVIDDFVIQGGGYDADLNKPDPCDPIISESNNGLSNLRGTVAMARMTEPNSATSQFYINVVDNNGLDWKDPNDRIDPNDANDVGYCVFGEVISGMNVVDRIANLPTEDNITVPDGNTLNDVPRPPGPVIIYNANILGDLDGDYYVDFKDYSIFANQWLDSGNSNPLKVTASDGSAGDQFGFSVSVDANYVIIGAPKYDGHTGAAYIFEYNDGNWTQQAKLTAYIFYRHQGGTNNWGQQARLNAADAAAQDRFGYSVSINGEYVIVGAIGDDPYSSFPDYTGSAYIFRHNGSAWAQQAKLIADDGASLDRFGYSVAIDGYYAIVGAYKNDENGSDSGSAYIFAPNEIDPDNWDQQAKLTASDGIDEDYFGASVAIGEGHALVGAYGNDDNGSSSGSAYIFAPNEIDPTNWDQKTKLTASDAAANDYFGYSVAIGLGRRAVVGAYGNDDSGSESGSAYILELCPDADLDDDCSVTWNDLAILTDNWLLN